MIANLKIFESENFEKKAYWAIGCHRLRSHKLIPSKKAVGLFLELVKFLSPIEIDLCEVLIGQISLIDSPLRQYVVELVETNSLIGIGFRPELFNIESFNQLTIHHQKHVESWDIRANVALTEVCIEFLKSEVLENLLAFCLEEAADFFNASVLLKKVCIFKLGTKMRVVSHQIFSEENAWVKPLADTRVDFVCKITALARMSQLLTFTSFIN